MITVGELFAGIGGLGLGLEMTGGFEVKWQVEINEFSRRVLEKNWPDVTRWDDVCTFPPASGVLDWTVDMITAGFPCQDISVAGRAEGLEGERSGLFYEVVRIADRLRPRYILLENVSALLVRGAGDVLRELAEIGYDAEWHCLSAATVAGAPHIRDRIFILAYPNSNRNLPFVRSSGKTSSLSEVNRQERRSRESIGASSNQRILADSESERVQGLRTVGEQILPPYVRPSLPVCESPGGRQHYWEIEPNVGRVVDGIPRRVDRLRQLGNAVVPQIPELLGRAILSTNALHGDSL